ncbi:MAG: VTT domain-containing protein [Candidatus Kerfeldbacteria bacterium]|nr:VTT domain-containing protein [Candidatus Kerfeldbacteria bacterium]
MNIVSLELLSVFFVGLLLPTFPWLPVRLAILIPLAAASINPWLVALTAATASALGTWPLYALSQRAATDVRVKTWMDRPWVQRVLRFLERRMFLAILVFALLPLPDQIMSISGGLRRYPAGRMMLAFFLGRLPYFLFLAWLGSTQRATIEAASVWLLRWLNW